MKITSFLTLAALLAAFSVSAQPSYNTVDSMLSAVTKPVTLRTGTTLQTLGYTTARDVEDPLLWSWDSTNTLATNRFRLKIGTNETGRLVHFWNGNARAFGVKADNSTDDRLAIQAAADYAMSNSIGFYMLGNVTSKLSGPIEARSDFYIYGKGGYWSLLGDYSGSKGDTNYGGIIRTLNAKFPAWGDPLVVQHSRIKLESIALLRNWPTGGTNTGPLLMIDHASDVQVRDVRFLATNHADWATFIRGNNVHGSQIYMRTKGQWGQDGWHIYAGTNHSLVDFDIESGDDSVAVGSERDQWIENVEIGPGTAISDASRALAVFQATYSTTPPAPPTNFIRYVIFHDIVAHGGQRTNWPVVVEEYDGANNTHSTNGPPRVVTDIIFDNVLTTRGAHTNSGAGALRVEGTERVTFQNMSFTNGNFAGIWLNRAKDTTLNNVRMFKTVRTGSTGGSAGLYAFDHYVNGLKINGGFFEAADGLHTILARAGTNLSIIGATIASVTNKFGLWIDNWTNAIIANNTFVGESAISLGTSAKDVQIFGNIFTGGNLTNVYWQKSNTNTYIEVAGTLYPTNVFANNVYVGTKSVISNSIFAVVSTNYGMRGPRMSQARIDLIPSPELGTLAVDDDASMYSFYNGSDWRVIPGWPRNRISVGTSGAATFSTIDGSNTPVIASSSNSWPLIATMQGPSATFGARLISRRSFPNGGVVTNDTELGGHLAAGTYTNGLFTDGDAGWIARTTSDWNDTNNGVEIVFSAQASNTVSRMELLLLNADYTTGQLPILIRKADGTYKRIGITNSGGNDLLYIIP